VDDLGADRRKELGELLRRRREQLVRAELDLPPVGRGRTTGLRREEVSYLSGVSVTWYTWLEQGRPMNPSRQVLDAVSRTLRLAPAEHAYVLSLAGYAPPPAVEVAPVAAAPAHLQRLMDGLGTSPAFAVAPDWGIAGWNHAYEALYPRVTEVDPADRNLLWLVFTDRSVRELLPDWEVDSRHFLAEFRAEAGPLLGHPAHAALVARLLDASPEFRAGWETHDLERFASRERRFHHPEVGELTFEHHRLAPSDHPGLHLVIYTPAPGSDTAARLDQLVRSHPRRPTS
jgi:transcriptional regulator with XRE-family HTH domain